MALAPRTLELLAPARDAETALAAISHGADAVYIGGPAFGARSAAGNSIEDIKRVVDIAHAFDARVYVTLNTILTDDELESARRIIIQLWEAGVDALIVQDPAILLMDIPPIDLHASTQWNSMDIKRLEMLAHAGFSQIVVPREYSLEQIRHAAQLVGDKARLEAFVHGALCVSYSGGCYAGQVLSQRSANRGCCPQICRLPFTLTDDTGKAVSVPDGGSATRHWLSLADMNRLDSLADLADAGVTSFKIEGRLKPVAYVKNVTAAYSRALDRIVAASAGMYRRASSGTVHLNFAPDPRRAFNRGFTRYFLGADDRRGITSWATPKWVGMPVATVRAIDRHALVVKTSATLHNGDGLGWFDARGAFHGFRVNRIDGNKIFTLAGSDTPTDAGVKLFRNNDIAFESAMARPDTARRTIGLSMTLRHTPAGTIAIDVEIPGGAYASIASAEVFTDVARSPQQERRLDTMARLGDTVYELLTLDDQLGDLFIPASALTDLRRRAIEALELAREIQRRRPRRLPSSLPADAFAGMHIDFNANVANHLARKFYTSHGAVEVDDAIEVKVPDGEIEVMTTAYCLRRELGACLRESGARRLPRTLFLDAPAGRLRLAFDCPNCRMKVYTNPK